MPFERFVQTGRVAVVVDGPHKGKVVTIVDIIDQRRVLIDGPETGVKRCGIRLNQLHLTKLRMKFPHTAGTRHVRRMWKTNQISEKWAATKWCQKLADKKKRMSMTDFDRFKLRSARTTRNKIRTQCFYVLRKTAYRNGTMFGKKKMAKCGDQPIKRKTKKDKKPTTTTRKQGKE